MRLCDLDLLDDEQQVVLGQLYHDISPSGAAQTRAPKPQKCGISVAFIFAGAAPASPVRDIVAP